MKFICCAVGETRKGLDRFVNLARLFPQHEFGWIGECHFENEKLVILGHGYFDNIITTVPTNIKFYGLKENVSEIYKEYDVFLLLSREDPCPLVIFEAKEVGLKVITLKNSGDSYKFLSDDDIIVDGNYDELKIVKIINNITETSKKPIKFTDKPLNKIYELINEICNVENNFCFNHNWYDHEVDGLFLKFDENGSNFYNFSNINIENIKFIFNNHFESTIKKVIVNVDDDKIYEYDAKKITDIFLKSNFKKINIKTDNYFWPLENDLLDNRLLGLKLNEIILNNKPINIKKIKISDSIDREIETKLLLSTPEDYITASHSGDLGDIIYSLPFIKSLNKKVRLYITNDKVSTREKFNQTKFESLKSLLNKLNYIYDVKFEKPNETITYDLDDHRKIEQKYIDSVDKYKQFSTMNLSSLYDLTYNTKSGFDSKWIDLKEKIIVDNKKIVISRSPRYNNKNFPWKEIYHKYKDFIMFVGSDIEYKRFVEKFGEVFFFKTTNLYELAMVINGSNIFIGNQSCPYAIAESMKKNTIQETSLNIRNCIFPRENALFNVNSIEQIDSFIQQYI